MKADIDALLLAHPRVEVWFYETLDSETLLHVHMKASRNVDPERVRERLNG
jgi:hypothetical protein